MDFAVFLCIGLFCLFLIVAAGELMGLHPIARIRSTVAKKWPMPSQPADGSVTDRGKDKQNIGRKRRLPNKSINNRLNQEPNTVLGSPEGVSVVDNYCPNPPAPDTILVSIGNQKWFFYLEKERIGSVTYTAEFVSPTDMADHSAPLAYDLPPALDPKCCTGRVIRVTLQAVHYVQAGHILRVVAGMYEGVTVASLMQTNRRITNNARRGEWLLVPLPGEQNLHWEYVDII